MSESENSSIECESTPDWIENPTFIRKEYTTETVDGFSEASPDNMMVRSCSYLTDSVKMPAVSPVFRTIGVNVVKTDCKLYHSAHWVDGMREYMEKWSHVYSEYMVVNWQLPNVNTSVIHLYGRVVPVGEDTAFDRAFIKFKEGDYAYRTARLKFFPLIITGPWLVRVSANNLGGNRPCIIGNKLTCTYNDGPNYIEVNIDIGSSKVASTLSSLIVRSSKSLCVDEGFLIEGQEPDELPERFIGLTRFIHCSIDSCKAEVTLPEEYREVTDQFLKDFKESTCKK